MKKSGSISVYFAIVLPAIIVFMLILIDIFTVLSCRISSYRYLDISANNMLSKYNKDLNENFGLYAIDTVQSIEIFKDCKNELNNLCNDNKNIFMEIELRNIECDYINKYADSKYFLKQVSKVINDKTNNEIIDFFIIGSFKHEFSDELNEIFLNGSKKVDAYLTRNYSNDEIESIINKRTKITGNNYILMLKNELGRYSDEYKINKTKEFIEKNMDFYVQKFSFNSCYTSFKLSAEFKFNTLIIPNNLMNYRITKVYEY